MKLENLIDFEWYNEPDNVLFSDHEMKIVAEPQTDFWLSLHHQMKKDNAHFFYKKCSGNFSLIVKWRFDKAENFNQCGIMVRVDERNWFKASILSKDESNPEIGTCLTVSGYSDWAGALLNEAPHEIFYKLEKKGEDFICSYSLDGEKYVRLRQFYLKSLDSEVKIGAYIAAPQHNTFEAILDDIEVKLK